MGKRKWYFCWVLSQFPIVFGSEISWAGSSFCVFMTLNSLLLSECVQSPLKLMQTFLIHVMWMTRGSKASICIVLKPSAFKRVTSWWKQTIRCSKCINKAISWHIDRGGSAVKWKVCSCASFWQSCVHFTLPVLKVHIFFISVYTRYG